MATFRVVLTESQNSTKSGKYLEVLGNYDPVHKVKEVNVERVKYWMDKGAQPTDTLRNFFIDKKIVAGKKKNVLPTKKATPSRKEVKANASKKPAPASAPASATPAPATEAPAVA